MSARVRAAPPACDPAFAAIEDLVVAATGHHYYRDKPDQLHERIARRMAATGIATTDLYLERLRDPAMGPPEWRRLETELTIKETFFFRFAEQFAALRSHILPGLIAARGESRRLRIWSAGCSTGAEPYSIAVIVRDLLGDAIDGWHVSILGTDIDEAALRAAREASYGGWSLRTMPPAERERLFVVEDGRWRLRQAYRGMVRFERLNILDLLGNTAPLQFSDYDLIVCRNMLIYFHPDTATALVDALAPRLAEDGWLLLGHAEAGLATGAAIAGAEIGGIIAYRHRAAAAVAAPRPMPTIPLPDRAALRRPPAPRSPPLLVPAAPERTVDIAVADGTGDVDEVRQLLDRGETGPAGLLIARLRRETGDDPVLLYLEGVRAAAEGDTAASVTALRGALYLDGGFAMAHYLLGEQLSAGGRHRAARRALANVIDLLAGIDPSIPIVEGEGRTAADLREAARSRRDALGPA